MPDELLIRNMTRPEVDTLVGWAAREGWNPGSTTRRSSGPPTPTPSSPPSSTAA